MPERVDHKLCDLCGLPVKVTGFELETKEGRKIFCCLGCKAIYTLYHCNSAESNVSRNSDDSSNKHD